MMSEEAAAKLRRWEHSCSCRDSSSFHMEDLPEEIQLLVLSLLSLNEAARTSLVSRSWTKLWTRHPNLCFDGTRDHPSDEDAVKIERGKFIETVNSVIQQHSGVGLNKFSIRCSLHKKCSDHLDRWIGFASASKAKIININLWSKRYGRSTKKVYQFPLEALGAQDVPFIHALLLSDVSIKPHLGISGFTKLRRLHLHCLEVLQLHMFHHTLQDGCWSGEELSCLRHLHHLKIVYMSGFRCYRPQVVLLCSILEKVAALELVTI